MSACRAPRRRAPRVSFAVHRGHQVDARGLQGRSEPEEHRRRDGANHQERQHTPVCGRGGQVEQIHELRDLRRERGDDRIERAVEKETRDDNAADRRRERQDQALREELPDDAPARRAKRQPDADLPLAREAAREQQVGDVGAADHQDQPEGKEQRSEDQAEPIARATYPGAGTERPGWDARRGLPERALRAKAASRVVPSPTPRRRRPLPPARSPGFRRPITSIGIVFLSCVAELRGQCKRCPVVGRCDAESSKAVGHDADDLERRAADRHAAADHIPVTLEQLVPAGMTQHDHRPVFGSLIVFREQRAAEGRLDSQYLEEVPRHEKRSRETPLDVRRAAVQHRGHVREDAGLAAHRVVLGPRQRYAFNRTGVRRPLELHGEQLARISHRIDAKEKEGVDREDDGDEPEAERYRRDNRESGERRTTERAKRVPDVARQVIDVAGAAGIATLVGGKRHRAEARTRPRAGVRGAQPGGDLLLRSRARCGTRAPRRARVRRGEEPPARESSGTGRGGSSRHASFITRPMAVDMRSHSLASTASCRRPDGVSW